MKKHLSSKQIHLGLNPSGSSSALGAMVAHLTHNEADDRSVLSGPTMESDKKATAHSVVAQWWSNGLLIRRTWDQYPPAEL